MYENRLHEVAHFIEIPIREAHQKVVAFEAERLQDSLWRKAFIRFVAFLLLLLFLIPLYYTLRDLYLGPPAKVQENG